MSETGREMLEELSAFVGAEAEAIRRWFHEQWSLPVAERVALGRCLDGLEFAAAKDGRFLQFRCAEENGSDFREGDLVRLSRGDPSLPLLSGSLHRVEDGEVWLEPDASGKNGSAGLETGRWVMDRSYLDLESM